MPIDEIDENKFPLGEGIPENVDSDNKIEGVNNLNVLKNIGKHLKNHGGKYITAGISLIILTYQQCNRVPKSEYNLLSSSADSSKKETERLRTRLAEKDTQLVKMTSERDEQVDGWNNIFRKYTELGEILFPDDNSWRTRDTTWTSDTTYIPKTEIYSDTLFARATQLIADYNRLKHPTRRATQRRETSRKVETQPTPDYSSYLRDIQAENDSATARLERLRQRHQNK